MVFGRPLFVALVSVGVGLLLAAVMERVTVQCVAVACWRCFFLRNEPAQGEARLRFYNLRREQTALK